MKKASRNLSAIAEQLVYANQMRREAIRYSLGETYSLGEGIGKVLWSGMMSDVSMG